VSLLNFKKYLAFSTRPLFVHPPWSNNQSFKSSHSASFLFWADRCSTDDGEREKEIFILFFFQNKKLLVNQKKRCKLKPRDVKPLKRDILREKKKEIKTTKNG
jgi:hypothetical protein